MEGKLYLDDTSWEGGEEWLRSQFRHYLLSLLSVSETNGKCLMLSNTYVMLRGRGVSSA